MKVFVLFVFLSVGTFVYGSAYQEREVPDGGAITGKILLKSMQVTPQLLPVPKDYQKSCGTSKAIPATVFGKRGEVPNAVVYIDKINSGKKASVAEKIILDQKNCEYIPHVLIAPAGSEIEITNSDPMLHNVHTYKDATPRPATIFNLAFPVPGLKIKRKLPETGRIVSLCDAGHPWMSAYIFVADHPYYTLTDEQGNFRLDGIPPGNYTVRVWREGIPRLQNNSNTALLTTKPMEASKPVKISAKQTVTLNFEL